MARILLAEDDEPTRVLLESMLTQAGHEVETAGDGLEALSLYRPGRFDLLCLDLRMPRLSGTALTRVLRHLARDQVVPILMITASLSPQDLADAYEAGITAVLRKPVLASRLRDAVSDLLDPRPEHRVSSA